jgi:thymidylate kinase
MGKLVFICGTHASGKTSILKKLEENSIIAERGSEIGKDLYYQRNFKTEEQGAEFEKEIVALELDRDNIIKDKYGIIAVETWYPGDLAYADIRNREIIKELIEDINTSPFIENAIGIWLRISKDEIVKRTKTFEDKKEWAGEFYEKIDVNIGRYLEKLNLLDNTYIIDANKAFDNVYEDVEAIIKKINS